MAIPIDKREEVFLSVRQVCRGPMKPDRGSRDSPSASPSELRCATAFLEDKVHKSLYKCDSENLLSPCP